MTGLAPRAAPEISVIVPTFNDGAFLGAALRSVAAQDVPNVEVIVVDDGSTVPVSDILEGVLPDAILLRQENAGPSAARNTGLGVARGRFVTFLDADDIWPPGALAALRHTFDRATADLVQGHVQRFVDDQTVSPPYQGFNLGACLFRRDALDRTGPFNEALRRSEDVDLFMRLQEAGAPRVIIPDVVLRYRRDAHTQVAPVRHALDRGVEDNWLKLLRQSLQRRRATVRPAPAPSDVTTTMPEAPGVTVIVTVRNGRERLPDALQSIRAQSLPPKEILACVGPSNDGTLGYLLDQPDVRVIEQDGQGLANARNQALALAETPLVAFLDHDDTWDPRKLEKQVFALSRFHAPAACIVNFETRLQGGRGPQANMGFPRLGWTPSALMAHREVFKTVGAFDPTLGLGCDTDWFDRLRRSGISCTVTGRVLMYKQIHQSNLSRDPAENRAAMLKLIRKRQLAMRAATKEGQKIDGD